MKTILTTIALIGMMANGLIAAIRYVYSMKELKSKGLSGDQFKSEKLKLRNKTRGVVFIGIAVSIVVTIVVSVLFS